jgi:hypothetical protein
LDIRSSISFSGIFWIALFILCLLLVPGTRYVQSAEVSQEYQLKAAFLYNFARFISWPEQALPAGHNYMNFCIVGPNPFASVLSNLESKVIDGHSIKIYYNDNLSSEQECHLTFYSNSEASTLANLNWSFSSENTVCVSDIPGFVEAGGDIEFIRKQDRIQFIINNTTLKKKGMQPRASLLQLAADIR